MAGVRQSAAPVRPTTSLRYPELAKHVADTIPHAKLVLIENVGHIPHLEAPDRFHPELIRFLKSDPISVTDEPGSR